MKYLAKDKGVEYEGIKNRGSIRSIEIKNLFPTKFKNQKDNSLIKALTNDIPPHNPSDELCISSNRWSLH